MDQISVVVATLSRFLGGHMGLKNNTRNAPLLSITGRGSLGAAHPHVELLEIAL